MSPLAFTQRTNQLLSYNRFFANAGSFIESFPESLDNFDVDEIVRFSAEVSGIPVNQIRPRDEVAQGRQAQQQQQQQEALLGQIQAGADTAATLQKAGIPVVPTE